MTVGSANVSVQYHTLTSSATAALDVTVDTLELGSLTVACAPYGDAIGDPSVDLSCLPTALGFKVQCRALAAFDPAPGLMQDVTEKVTWASTAAATPIGLSSLDGGPVRQSFEIRGTGAAALYATANGQTSSKVTTLGQPWALQAVAATVTGITVTAAPNPIPPGQPLAVTLGQPAQLTATAALTSSAGGCTPSMPPRDFSLRTTWSTVPASSPVADVSFSGLVEPLAPGDVTVHWRYSGTATFQGDVPITVVP